ncbi:MAG: hypothetical protein A2020_05830 [Lentisphaerae bacterium GWF2_45_14]|nr:MAG: hypothetical protein A2020_05830 [Lentisphaerae bacterium GWF2_45_14]
MKLSILLQREAIVTGINETGGDKRSIVAGMLDTLFANTGLKDEGIEKSVLLDAIMFREEELTTAIGEGFAFPHARINETLKGSYMLFGVSPGGVAFGSLDRKPVNFFLMSIVPGANSDMLLKSRAAFMRVMNIPGIREKILSMGTGEIWELLDKSGIRITGDILARDIMSPQLGIVRQDMSLRDVAIALHFYHTDSLPVVEDGNKFMGDISCYDLFTYELPNFFLSLKTISFVKHMNPFERYFNMDNRIRVSEIKRDREFPVIAPDATLMEIIFQMTTYNRHHLYVVEDGKLLGMIDRFAIVDKILLTT